MEKLKAIKNANINGILCDFYSNGQGEFFMTRQQIGKALGYEKPEDGIRFIHNRHRDRLDKLSVQCRLNGTDGKRYQMILYSAKGVYEICRWSRQPKANEFYDKVYDILESLRLGYLSLNKEHNSPHWQATRLESKNIRKLETAEIKELVEYAKAQGSENAEKYYIALSKLANKTVGISSKERETATINQLNTLILVENIINHMIQEGIRQELPYKKIYQTCKQRLEQFQEIAFLTSKEDGGAL